MSNVRLSWEFTNKENNSTIITQDEILEFNCVRDTRVFNKTGRLKNYVDDLYFVIDTSEKYCANEDKIFYLDIVKINKIGNSRE